MKGRIRIGIVVGVLLLFTFSFLGSVVAAPTATLNPNVGSVGTTVTVSGTGAGTGVIIIIKYDGVNGPTVATTKSSGGTYTASFVVPPSSVGDHNIVITGSGQTLIRVFHINEASPTSLAVTYYPGTIDVSGDRRLAITGKLTSDSTPAIGIPNKSIELYYYRLGTPLQPHLITSVTTDDNGDFTIVGKIPQDTPLGSYVIGARFSGDIDYTSSTAKAGPPYLQVVPEYALGALAAIGACFGGLIVFKKRSSVPQIFHL